MDIVQIIYIVVLLSELVRGSSISCLNCVFVYNSDLSEIHDANINRAVTESIDPYTTTPECRAGAEDAKSHMSTCSSSTQGKIPACVAYEGDFVFVLASSKLDANFTASVVYRGCVEVDANYLTSCYQVKETEWMTLPLPSKLPMLTNCASAGYYTGSVCHTTVLKAESAGYKQDSGGLSGHKTACIKIILLFVFLQFTFLY